MTETTVELVNWHSTPKRVMIGLIGLAVAVFPVWDLWPGIASLTVVSPVFWIIGLGGLGIGATLLAASIFGQSTQLSIGPEGASLVRDSPFRRRVERLAPELIGAILVQDHEWSDGPATWHVTVAVQGRRPLVSEDFPDRAQAEQLADRLNKALNRQAGVRPPRPADRA